METNVKETLEGLVAVHGPEKVLTLAQDILKPVQGQPGANTLKLEAGGSWAVLMGVLLDAAHAYKDATENMVKTGQDAIKASELMNTEKPLPVIPINFNHLQPHNLDYVNDQLESAAILVDQKGGELAKAHEGRGELYKAIQQLETQVQLDEAEAIMGWEYENGKPVANVNGIKVPMSNDTVRDAFRRQASAESRKQLAAKKGEVQILEVALAKAQAEYDTAVKTQEAILRKADKQAAALNFLARG